MHGDGNPRIIRNNTRQQQQQPQHTPRVVACRCSADSGGFTVESKVIGGSLGLMAQRAGHTERLGARWRMQSFVTSSLKFVHGGAARTRTMEGTPTTRFGSLLVHFVGTYGSCRTLWEIIEDG